MKRKYQILTIITGGIIILDQFTKYLIHQALDLHQSYVIIEGFFSLTYIQNPGAAFGIFADAGVVFRTVFLTGVGFLAILFLCYYFQKSPERAWRTHLSFALILGGAFGNLIDRVRLGRVVDFLDFYLGRFHWPAFNVADSAISVGLTLLIILFLISSKGEEGHVFLSEGNR